MNLTDPNNQEMFSPQQGNGWTQYQKLVLAQLSRHEEDIASIKEEIVDFKIFSSKLDQKLDTLLEKINVIRDAQVDMEKFTEEQKEKFQKQKEELDQIKWKIGVATVVSSFIINVLVLGAIKYWVN